MDVFTPLMPKARALTLPRGGALVAHPLGKLFP